MLRFRVRKSFIDHASSFVLDVDVYIPQGQNITVFFGSSGSGKTLSLQCLAGLMRPDEGEILLKGRCLFSSQKKICLPASTRGVGDMLQDSSLFPPLTVPQHVSSGLPVLFP